MLNIEDTNHTKPFALFNLGFRPFFLVAGIYACVAMAIWMAIYLTGVEILPTNYPAMTWHAHEMVFGFSIAVISGFLLTAIGNWTGVKMVSGLALLLLTLLWMAARALPFSGIESALLWTAAADLLFMLALLVAMLIPVFKARQWKQLPVVLKVVLMLMSNGLFYLGALNILPASSIHFGLYSGLYLVISLILLMGRRVIPFFIEKGVDEEATIKNWKWLDISSLFLFLMFMIVDVFLANTRISEPLAGLLFILHSIRLWGWHSKGIWKKPLLWVLYIGYAFMVLGFGLKAITTWQALSPWISLHAFATGGIGIITAGMMSRVALGHTGRNVFNPPAILSAIFMLLVTAAVFRVFLPMAFPGQHLWWMGLSQASWILGFGLFVFTYAPMLLKPRTDGRAG